MDECYLWQFWELYLGLHRTEASIGSFGEDLNPVFVDILRLIKQLHVENKARHSCFAVPTNKADFPHHGLGDPKFHQQNPGWELGSVATIWISGWAEEIPIGFSCSCIAEAMAVSGCWCFQFQLQYFVHDSYLNLLPIAVLFLTGVSPPLPTSLAVAFQRRSKGKKKAHMLVELNSTELAWNQFACNTVWHFNKTVANNYNFIFIVLKMGIQTPENGIFIAPGELGQWEGGNP